MSSTGSIADAWPLASQAFMVVMVVVMRSVVVVVVDGEVGDGGHDGRGCS